MNSEGSGNLKMNTNKGLLGFFRGFFRGFIPRHISNKAFISFYDFLRKLHKVFKGGKRSPYKKNLIKNKNGFSAHAREVLCADGYIEEQLAYDDMFYGKKTIRFCGCEIIAVYNALRNIHGKAPISFPEIINEFERDGIVLSGLFGTAPKAINDFLQRHGYRTNFSINIDEFDSISNDFDTMILTMYNDGDDIMQEVHTVCVTGHNGKLIGHNVKCTGKPSGPFESISDMLSKVCHGRAKGISLIGIRQKD